MWPLSLIEPRPRQSPTGCASLCHVSHRSGHDGGWFCWYARIQRQIVLIGGGPDEWVPHGRTAIYFVCDYESLRPQPKLPFCTPDLCTQRYYSPPHSCIRRQKTSGGRNHSLHKHSRSHLQYTTAYPTPCPGAHGRMQASAR